MSSWTEITPESPLPLNTLLDVVLQNRYDWGAGTLRFIIQDVRVEELGDTRVLVKYVPRTPILDPINDGPSFVRIVVETTEFGATHFNPVLVDLPPLTVSVTPVP